MIQTATTTNAQSMRCALCFPPSKSESRCLKCLFDDIQSRSGFDDNDDDDDDDDDNDDGDDDALGL